MRNNVAECSTSSGDIEDSIDFNTTPAMKMSQEHTFEFGGTLWMGTSEGQKQKFWPKMTPNIDIMQKKTLPVWSIR